MRSNKLKTMLLLAGLSVSLLAGCGSKDVVSENIENEAVAEEESKSASKTEETQKTAEAEDNAAEKDSEADKEAEKEENPEGDPIYSELAEWSFEFSSGAGGWGTELTVNPDGSFEGLYSDSDMGDIGPGYPDGTLHCCRFKGQFTGYTKVSPFIYELDFDTPEYENTPGTEEISEGIRYVYSVPYGLDGTQSLILYLPGTPWEVLPEAYIEWIFQPYGTYVKTNYDGDGEYYRSFPAELPFCGLYNSNEEDGFYSSNKTDKNKTFVMNRVRFPGLKSDQADLNDDGTYYYVDSDPLGMYRITNICQADKDSPSMWEDAAGFAKNALKKLPKELQPEDADDVYIVDKDNLDSMSMAKFIFLTGEYSVFASWNTGSNEDTMYNIARITSVDDRTYIYIVSWDPEGEIMTGEAAYFYLGSLSFTGSPGNLSSAGADNADSVVLAYVKPNDDKSILAERQVWITEDDTDLLEEYGIDPDDMTDDYALGSEDKDYSKYELVPDCPIYIQFPENIFNTVTDAQGLKELSEGRDDWGRLMQLYLDKDGKVLFMYEPYTP